MEFYWNGLSRILANLRFYFAICFQKCVIYYQKCLFYWEKNIILELFIFICHEFKGEFTSKFVATNPLEIWTWKHISFSICILFVTYILLGFFISFLWGFLFFSGGKTCHLDMWSANKMSSCVCSGPLLQRPLTGPCSTIPPSLNLFKNFCSCVTRQVAKTHWILHWSKTTYLERPYTVCVHPFIHPSLCKLSVAILWLL